LSIEIFSKMLETHGSDSFLLACGFYDNWFAVFVHSILFHLLLGFCLLFELLILAEDVVRDSILLVILTFLLFL